MEAWLCGQQSLCARRRCDERSSRDHAGRDGPRGAAGARGLGRPERAPAGRADLSGVPRSRHRRSRRQVLPRRAERAPRLGDVRRARRRSDDRAHVPGQVAAEPDVPHLGRLPRRSGAAASARADRADPARASGSGVAEGALPVADPVLQHLELHAERSRGVGSGRPRQQSRGRRDRGSEHALRRRRARRLRRLRHAEPRHLRGDPQARARPQLPRERPL